MSNNKENLFLKDRSHEARTGRFALILTDSVKIIATVVLIILVTLAWGGSSSIGQQESVIKYWKSTNNYAVLYPVLFGNADQADTDQVGITVARDLYPRLDAEGAIYIDASQYEAGSPNETSMPVPSIVVNTNYLKQYPILGVNGKAISVSKEEKSWVVAVPAKYKKDESAILNNIREERTSVAQGEEGFAGDTPVPMFNKQEITIIWIASGQKVFSFNTEVNPKDGNKIQDPIIEIMTPGNSLSFDRANSATGDINTCLKIKLKGNAAATYKDLLPTLQKLKISTELPSLVMPDQELQQELNNYENALRWCLVVAGASLLIMCGFSASLITIFCDRRRREITVRRLQGLGLFRAYRSLWGRIGATWLGQLIVSGAIFAAIPSMSASDSSQIGTKPWWHLLIVLIGALVVDICFAVCAIAFVERRNMVKRVKEM